MSLMEKIFGDLNEKEVKKVSKIADKVMACLLYTSPLSSIHNEYTLFKKKYKSQKVSAGRY